MEVVKVKQNKGLTNKEFISTPVKVTRNNAIFYGKVAQSSSDLQTKWLKVRGHQSKVDQIDPIKMQKSPCFHSGPLIINRPETDMAKVAQNSLPLLVPRFRGINSFQSKVDTNRPSLTHVKSGRVTTLSPSISRSMLFSESVRLLFCKDQRSTKPGHILFHIQIIGIERDRPLSTKEVLWKR